MRDKNGPSVNEVKKSFERMRDKNGHSVNEVNGLSESRANGPSASEMSGPTVKRSKNKIYVLLTCIISIIFPSFGCY